LNPDNRLRQDLYLPHSLDTAPDLTPDLDGTHSSEGKIFDMVDRRTGKKKKRGKLNIKAPITLDQPVLVIVPQKPNTPQKH
jgi:hypothetical protein